MTGWGWFYLQAGPIYKCRSLPIMEPPRMHIQQAGPEVVPTQGTIISEALRAGNSAFNSKERKFKSIVLITDGEDHDPQAVPLAQKSG